MQVSADDEIRVIGAGADALLAIGESVIDAEPAAVDKLIEALAELKMTRQS
jgi:hypothetical protein